MGFLELFFFISFFIVSYLIDRNQKKKKKEEIRSRWVGEHPKYERPEDFFSRIKKERPEESNTAEHLTPLSEDTHSICTLDDRESILSIELAPTEPIKGRTEPTGKKKFQKLRKAIIMKEILGKPRAYEI